MMPKGKFIFWMISIAVLLFPAHGLANTGFDGEGRSATAEFAFTKTPLTTELFVTLTNAATDPAANPTYILTAVFFNIVPQGSEFGEVDALLAPGSQVYVNGVLLDPQPADGNVGGEWAFIADIGISSSGFDIFGPKDRFSTLNLAGPDSPNGIEYGIVGPGGLAPTVPPTSYLAMSPIIQNAVVFHLSGPLLDTPYEVTNVVFQYGTDLDEPHFVGSQSGEQPPIPEPVTMVSVFVGALAVGGYVRKRLI